MVHGLWFVVEGLGTREPSALASETVQGYLTDKKTHAPRSYRRPLSEVPAGS